MDKADMGGVSQAAYRRFLWSFQWLVNWGAELACRQKCQMMVSIAYRWVFSYINKILLNLSH